MSASEECGGLQGRDELSTLFYFSPLFPFFFTIFSLFLIAGVTTLCMGEVFSLELEFSFEEWRAGTFGWILESAFSAVDLLVSTTQNGSWCYTTRTAGLVFSQE